MITIVTIVLGAVVALILDRMMWVGNRRASPDVVDDLRHEISVNREEMRRYREHGYHDLARDSQRRLRRAERRMKRIAP